MKTQPLKGMRDLLPREQVALRDYIQGQILATYRGRRLLSASPPRSWRIWRTWTRATAAII